MDHDHITVREVELADALSQLKIRTTSILNRLLSWSHSVFQSEASVWKEANQLYVELSGDERFIGDFQHELLCYLCQEPIRLCPHSCPQNEDHYGDEACEHCKSTVQF